MYTFLNGQSVDADCPKIEDCLSLDSVLGAGRLQSERSYWMENNKGAFKILLIKLNVYRIPIEKISEL